MKKTDDNTDRCVLCGGYTEYMKDTPVEQRTRYVTGAGQLCKECYDTVYMSEDTQKILKKNKSNRKIPKNF